MVYYSTQAEYDLTQIFVALLSWASDNGQVHMDREHVISYYNDLYHAFDCIDQLPYHAPDMPHMQNTANSPILTNGINAQHGTAFIIFMPPMRS
jgi:hypothetical protein